MSITVFHYSVQYLDDSGVLANSSIYADELDLMEEINQELDLDTPNSEPKSFIKRSAIFL